MSASHVLFGFVLRNVGQLLASWRCNLSRSSRSSSSNLNFAMPGRIFVVMYRMQDVVAEHPFIKGFTLATATATASGSDVSKHRHGIVQEFVGMGI